MLRYHLIPVQIAITKSDKISAGEDVEKRKPLHTVDGNVSW
jgi:GTP-binding protein EngB required for normal cell division